jgi:DNA mismatch repair protein MutL
MVDSISGVPASAGQGSLEDLRFLAQLSATYLLCEAPDALVILDQHAAAERVTFHRLQRDLRARGVAMQRLLVPSTLRMDPAEIALIEEAHDDVLRMGMDVRSIGSDVVAVLAVPALTAALNPEKLVRDLASELANAGGRGFSAVIDRVLATMACHASLRAGDAISAEEARALLEALAKVDFGGHCPHGRPIVTRLPLSELERRVGRR